LHSAKWLEYPFLVVFIISSKQTKDISHNHHRYHRIITYIIHTTYLTKTINLANITTSNKFEHKHKSPTFTNISLKYLIKHYQHQQVQTKLSHKVLTTPTNIRSCAQSISTRWAAGLVRRWARRSMRVVWCRRLSLYREEIACVRPDEYISYSTRISILTKVWNWVGSAAGNNGGGGVKPDVALRLCMY
jgi:tRNA G10  N-methylase Trm11